MLLVEVPLVLCVLNFSGVLLQTLNGDEEFRFLE